MMTKHSPATALGFVGFALLLLLGSAAPAAAAIACVTSASVSATNAASLTVNSGWGSPSCTGTSTGNNNTVVVVVAIRSDTATVSSITDATSGGSAYRLRNSVTNTSPTPDTRVEVWSTDAGTSISSTSVTVNLTGAADFAAAVASYSGVAILGQGGTWNSGSSGATALNSSFSVLDANNWVVAGFAAAGSATFSPNVGTIRQSQVANGNVGMALTDNFCGAICSAQNWVTLSASELYVYATLELRSVTGVKTSTDWAGTSVNNAAGGTCSLTNMVTIWPGNTIVLIVALRDNTKSAVGGVSDGGGGVYTLRVDSGSTGTNARVQIFTAPIVSTAQKTQSVVVSGTAFSCASTEYTGVTAFGNTLTATSGASSTTSASIGPVTTQDANNFVVAGFAIAGKNTATAVAPSIVRASAAASSASYESNSLTDNTSASPGPVTNNLNLSGTGTTWAAAALELRSRTCGTVSEPTYVAANAQIATGQTNVYWSSPTYPNVIVVRKPGKFTSEMPSNYRDYAAGSAPGGSLGTATVSYLGSGTSDPDTPGAGNYYYKVFAYDTSTGPTCYSSGTVVNPADGVSANTALAAPHVWSYAMANGSMMKPGIAGWDGTINTSSLAARMIALDTTTGAQKWAVPTTAGVQGWLNWLPTNSALGYWTLDGTAADSSGRNDGTLIGSPTFTAGKIGQALSLTAASSQYVNVPHNAVLNAYPLTVAAWVKWTGNGGSPDQGGIVNKYLSASSNGWSLFTYNGALCAWYFAGSSANSVFDSTNCTLSVAGFNNNVWHHVAFVVDASGGKLYVDGVQRTSRIWTGTAQATTTTQNVSIGQYPGATNGYFTGLIDEVRLYTRALSAAEVSALYATTAASTATVFAADQNPGGTVYAVDPVTGAKSWQVTPAGADGFQAPTSAQLRAYTTGAALTAFQAAYPTTTDVVFAASYNATNTNCGTPSTNNKLFAIRPSDGVVLWTFNSACTSTVDYISGMPAVDYVNNRIFLTSHAGSGSQTSFWAINGLNGTLIGSVPNLGHLDSSPTPSYDGTRIYVGNTAGKLYAINNANPPTLRWTFDTLSATAAVKGFIWQDFYDSTYPLPLYFATSDGYVRCVMDQDTSAAACAATGWPVAVSGPSTPMEMGGYLYVGSSNGNLYEINLSTNPLVVKSLVVGDGTAAVGDVSTDDGNGSSIFVGTNAGRIYKIQIPLP